jgi:hypothetical protein
MEFNKDDMHTGTPRLKTIQSKKLSAVGKYCYS